MIFVLSIVTLYVVSFERSFKADQFLLKDHDLKITHERIFDIFFNFVIRKNLKKGTTALHCIYTFKIIHRGLLRTVETKSVSFYKIHLI